MQYKYNASTCTYTFVYSNHYTKSIRSLTGKTNVKYLHLLERLPQYEMLTNVMHQDVLTNIFYFHHHIIILNDNENCYCSTPKLSCILIQTTKLSKCKFYIYKMRTYNLIKHLFTFELDSSSHT
jgi:hypothetical protein